MTRLLTFIKDSWIVIVQISIIITLLVYISQTRLEVSECCCEQDIEYNELSEFARR